MTEDDATFLRLECLRLAVDASDGIDASDIVSIAEMFFEFVTGSTMSSKQ